MSQPQSPNDALSELQQRVTALEAKLAEMLGQNEHRHPELLDKAISALRGKLMGQMEAVEARLLRLEAEGSAGKDCQGFGGPPECN